MRLSRFSVSLAALAMLLAGAAVNPQNVPALAGRWEGTLMPRVQKGSRDLSQRANRPRLPTVVIITTAGDGTHAGTWASTSENRVTDISEIVTEGDSVLIKVNNWGGSFKGKLSSDGSTLDGAWTQNDFTSPFVLKKAAPQ